MNRALLQLWVLSLQREEGQDLVEYGLLMVLVALLAIVAIKSLGTSITNVFSNAAATLQTQPNQ